MDSLSQSKRKSVDTESPAAASDFGAMSASFAPQVLIPQDHQHAQDEEFDLQEAARRDVIETTFGDMEELCHDIEGSTVYSIRGDILKAWGIKLRNMHKTLVEGGASTVLKKNKSGVFKATGKLAGMRRRNSQSDLLVEHRQSEVGSPLLTTARTGPRGSDHSSNSVAVNNIAQHASGTLYILLDALCESTSAEWATAFVYVAKTEELVLVAAAGKKHLRPGTVRLAAQAGIEGHVLHTGIAVNVAHAYTEDEFSDAQDKQTNTRTKSTVVFPICKPGNSSAVLGLIEVGNKQGATAFDVDDESRIAECTHFIAQVINKFPGDITNSNSFDPALLAARETEKLAPLAAVPTVRAGTRIFRTAKLGHLRRQEVLRDASQMTRISNITNAMEHVSQVNESWKNAVMLNVELEGEIRRLHEALRVSRRETTRLQDVVQDLRRQLENADLPPALQRK